MARVKQKQFDVEIRHGPPEPDDSFDDWPKDRWQDLVAVKRSFIATKIPYDCRQLVQFCREAEQVWEHLGYGSAADMVRRGYELDPSTAEMAVAWLMKWEPDEPVPLEMAVLRPHGGDRKSEDAKNQDSNRNLIRGGTNTDYTLARLRRDNPELADRVESGELSANAAAIKAGFRKQQFSVPVGDVQGAVKRLLKHYDKRELIRCLTEFDKLPPQRVD